MSEQKKNKKTKYVGAFELGESFPCACGEMHPLTGAWFAAHWQERLEHECPKCGTVHTVHAGEVYRRA